MFSMKPALIARSSLATLVLALLVSATGCAAPSDDAPDETTTEAAVTVGSADRKAILNGVRVRVMQDFAGVASLKDQKLVFVVDFIETNGRQAFIRARVLKRNEQGKDSELEDKDFVGSAFEEHIRDGFFDGPNVVAALEKKGDAFAIMTGKSAEGEAFEGYVLGATDAPFSMWAEQFQLPAAWFE